MQIVEYLDVGAAFFELQGRTRQDFFSEILDQWPRILGDDQADPDHVRRKADSRRKKLENYRAGRGAHQASVEELEPVFRAVIAAAGGVDLPTGCLLASVEDLRTALGVSRGAPVDAGGVSRFSPVFAHGVSQVAYEHAVSRYARAYICYRKHSRRDEICRELLILSSGPKAWNGAMSVVLATHRETVRGCAFPAPNEIMMLVATGNEAQGFSNETILLRRNHYADKAFAGVRARLSDGTNRMPATYLSVFISINELDVDALSEDDVEYLRTEIAADIARPDNTDGAAAQDVARENAHDLFGRLDEVFSGDHVKMQDSTAGAVSLDVDLIGDQLDNFLDRTLDLGKVLEKFRSKV